MITLLSEALCFTTYLSLYLHRIVKFYFSCFLTFIFSFDWCFFSGRGGKHTLGYLFIKTLKFCKNFAFVSIFKRFKILIILVVFAAIFRLKCNEQHSSIPKSQIKTLVTFL